MPESAAAIPPGKSSAIKYEHGPKRFTNRPAKFHSAVGVTLTLPSKALA